MTGRNRQRSKAAREQNPANRNPSHWGQNSDTIRVTVGQQVDRGEFLAWAGQTGPGGNRNQNIVNTRLHIFFAHRDPTDKNWYFFDPYGIYSTPSVTRRAWLIPSPLIASAIPWPGRAAAQRTRRPSLIG